MALPDTAAETIEKESEISLTTAVEPTSPIGEEQIPEAEVDGVQRNAMHILSPSKSTRLKLGSRVIILGTDNVEQRVPQYVGMQATIVVVPVHPATWFKVKFDNGKIVTFRPSALRLVSDGTSATSSSSHGGIEGSPLIKKVKVVNRQRSNSLKLHDKTPPPTILLNGKTRLLTSIHLDKWRGCKVRITSGRLTGHTVTVLGAGNGWVQLESPYGELAKRANELELISTPDGSAATPAASVRPSLLSVEELPPPVACLQPVLQRRRSNSEPGSPTEFSNRRNEFSSSNKYRKERRAMDLQREYVQKYIDKQQAKIRTRPDLRYWLNRIQGSMVDSDFERNISRDVRSHFCHSCFMEMWSGSKYCWNELCTASPVYFKLPGASGTPPLSRYTLASAVISKTESLMDIEVPVDESSKACEVLLSLRSDIRTNSDSESKDKFVSPEKSTVTFALNESYSSCVQKRKAVESLKPARSDSSTTDCEDLRDETDANVIANRNNLKPQHLKKSPPALQTNLASQPSHANSSSPRMPFKRIRLNSSPFSAGGSSAPPSAEEFARIVLQHEQEKLQSSQPSSAMSTPNARVPLPGIISTRLPTKTSPFSTLTSTSTPLLTSFLHPDYPTNKAIVLTSPLEEKPKV